MDLQVVDPKGDPKPGQGQDRVTSASDSVVDLAFTKQKNKGTEAPLRLTILYHMHLQQILQPIVFQIPSSCILLQFLISASGLDFKHLRYQPVSLCRCCAWTSQARNKCDIASASMSHEATTRETQYNKYSKTTRIQNQTNREVY